MVTLKDEQLLGLMQASRMRGMQPLPYLANTGNDNHRSADMRGLVSFCIFGDDSSNIYYKGAIKNAIAYANWRPNWDLWFYIGQSVPESLLEAISYANPRAQFSRMSAPENQTSTYWRMNAVFHSDHDFILMRDVDSRLSLREQVAVDEWLASDFPYHSMRDHPFHGRQLLAGLWGLKRSVYHELQGIPREVGQHEDFYGVDQIALTNYVWPQCRRKVMAHIGCYCIYERPSQRRPFSIPRSPGTFVGQGFTGDNMLRYPGHEDLVVADSELLANPDIFMEEFRVPRAVSA